MNWVSITGSIILPAVVSATVTIVTLLLKHYFEERLEKLKSSQTIHGNIEEKYTERRLKNYPVVVELTYRIRNMARDLTRQNAGMAPSLVEELAVRTKEYEELLYEIRLDLRRDDLFEMVHRFKMTSFAFSRQATDMASCVKDCEPEDAARFRERLNSIYRELDNEHRVVVDKLSLRDAPVG